MSLAHALNVIGRRAAAGPWEGCLTPGEGRGRVIKGGRGREEEEGEIGGL